MEKKFLDELWAIRGDHWEEITEDADIWSECGRCKTMPRIWRFDNGCFAKCICYQQYDNGPVRAESVMSHAHRHTGSLLGYDRDRLRVQWNKFARDGIERNKLPKGQW